VPVDDLWYLSKRGPNGEKVKSQRYGRGKRWRCRYEDANGEPRTKFFERKADADAWDIQARAGLVQETQTDQAQRRTTFREYAERWRLSRQIGQSLDYQRHIESRLRHHHYPYFGNRSIRAINVTDVLEWIGTLLQTTGAQSSVKTYFDLFNNIMNAAVVDKVVSTTRARRSGCR
jgi:hypothetical protein